jgi:hypothetical protein
MQVANTRTIALAAVALLACQAVASAADANGTWKWKFTRQDGQEIELSVMLKVDGEKVTGTFTGPMNRTVDIKNGTFQNDEVKFETEFEFGGNTITTKYKGKVEGDTIKGNSERERDGQVRTRDWEAKRAK